ncbi:MAG: hypothetical protein ABSH48_09095 [Verrucomicrobiota bacterium]
MNPPASFVPLTAAPAPSSPREFRLAVVNGPDHSDGHRKAAGPDGFQSLEAARPVAVSLAAGAEKKIGEPRVSVQRDGDRITHLRIQCSCGQIIDLACVYDPPPASR